MIKGNKVLAVIPARGGSKGIPGKNIINLAGKPLIAWTIEKAKKSKWIDRLVLSSDDDDIIKVAREWGCEVPFVRPQELAQDDTPGVEPVLHAIRMLPEYDYIVLLQPTSPLRQTQDIDDAIQFCLEHNAPACVSLTETDKSPYWMYQLEENQTMRSLIKSEINYTRRQDLPKTYELNGAIYVAHTKWLIEHKSFLTPQTIGYIMDKARSIDIDNEIDLLMAETILKNNQRIK